VRELAEFLELGRIKILNQMVRYRRAMELILDLHLRTPS
jgi:hypothetical protein